MAKRSQQCQIRPVGKRRDGGMRFWCLEHRADATAKYGRRAPYCRYAHVAPISKSEAISVNVSKYPGGVAVWGAVAPIYDTTEKPLEHGVHVHARCEQHGLKVIDGTFRRVTLVPDSLGPESTFVISELDAIYFMVSSVFEFVVKNIVCSLCGAPHLDRDWFSVHPHQRHLCAACGRQFTDEIRAIGNPLAKVRRVFSGRRSRLRQSTRTLHLRQADYPGGIQIWDQIRRSSGLEERRSKKGFMSTRSATTKEP